MRVRSPSAGFHLTLVLSFAVGAAGGCSGDDGGDGSLALADMPTAYASATCAALVRCAGPLLGILYVNEADCRATLAARMAETFLANIQAAVDAGTVIYDSARASACLSETSSLACDQWTAQPASCRDVFQGTVALGQACDMDEECAGDAFCQNDAACPGTCTALRGAAASCSEDSECQVGLECQGGSCVTPAGEGQACEGGTNPECGGMLSCVGGSSSSAGVCRTFASVQTADVDETCDLSDVPLCKPGLSCVVTALSPSVTWACRAAAAPNGPCRYGLPSQCPEGQYCDGIDLQAQDVEGACTPLPTTGQPCADTVGVACAAGLTCDDTTSTCAALQPVGGTCSSGDLCHSGLCDGGICAVPDACDL